MKQAKGISLIALIITIIVIIILAAIVIGTGLTTPENANRAKFASNMSEVQHAVKVKLADNYNQFITNPDSVDLNAGFTRIPVNGAPDNFDSFALEGAETGSIGYLVKLDTIKMENLTIGQAYKTATEVTFGLADAFVYDAEGEVFYALGHKYQDEVYYSLADLETGGTGAITPSEPEEVDYANAPDLTYLPEATTYAITYNGSNNPVTMTLAQAKMDTTWYDYRSSEKKWANIKTTGSGNEAYWVWIPRYAYKIDSPNTVAVQTINIKFLSGTSNTPADGTQLPADYVVHPAFTFGGVELSGIWVAKFEASSSNPTKVEGTYYTGGGNDAGLQVKVLPNVYSWRNIQTGNIQTVCMNMTSGSGSVGTTTNLDTHQMKNIEWGAVTYLGQSMYGKNSEVWINPYGDSTAWKMKTGYAGENADSAELAEGNTSLSQYNIGNGPQASTTGNVYGVYDMSGGAWEYTASYIDNGNANFETYTSTYFTDNILKTQYAKYYDVYEPGNQEKQGGIYYGTGINTIWNADSSQASNSTRKSLTDATYAKMVNKKGDAMYETSNGVSYYGKKASDGKYDWLINSTDTTTNMKRSWNNDYQLYGHGSRPWILRGGVSSYGTGAGTFATIFHFGGTYMSIGFRPVLVSGATL